MDSGRDISERDLRVNSFVIVGFLLCVCNGGVCQCYCVGGCPFVGLGVLVDYAFYVVVCSVFFDQGGYGDSVILGFADLGVDDLADFIRG